MSVALLDKKTSADLVKLVIFMVVTVMATSVLVVTIGNISFQSATTYKALFVDATGVVKGDDVRISGVKVGSVSDVEIVDRDRALVTFSVFDSTTLYETTNAAIRYRNLVGQRYISLTQEIGDAEPLEEDDTIPTEQTSPALDLTVLFNGFKPLFEALSPDDLNQLSYEVVQVFQGESGTVESLLQSTASVTQTLADRDQVIGDLLENLDYVLDRIADRDQQLSALIISFRDLLGGLEDDKDAILDSLDGISDLAVQTADLVKGVRPPFVEDVKQLRRFAGTLEDGRGEIDRALQVLPLKLNKIGRTATYGSWFNFYLCDFRGTVRIGPTTVLSPQYSTGAERCDLG